MQEQEIIELLLEKDEKGMDALLLHYGPLMRYIIAPIVKKPQDQEDCLSEAAMRIWEKVGQFDPERGSWSAWLTAVTRHTALNYIRNMSRHDRVENIPEDMPSSEPGPEELVIRQERQAAVDQALRRLSPGERMLFYRKYYYLQSTAQIASELGMTERAVEGKLYRLKKRLRNMLGGDGHGQA